jgi:hypothetical protein
MGIFGKIKDRIQHKEDFSEMRSHVIGEPFANEPFAEPEPLEPAPIPRRERFESYEPRSGEVPTLEPMPFEREPAANWSQGNSSDYEILDRLKFIESQLAAIKSQNELINERIKNLDVKLGRRY